MRTVGKLRRFGLPGGSHVLTQAPHVLTQALFVALGALGLIWPSYAVNFDTGKDVKVRWDNTLKYSAVWRVKDQSDALLADPNLDDGDRNLDKGLVSNRVDWLTELDIIYKQSAGVRFSGAAWYDAIYNKSNDNDSPATVNSISVPFDEFTDDTRDLMGRKAEVLDLFAFGNFNLGRIPTTVRGGKHTLLYGESLFFGANGIAGGQSPVDIIKLLTVPGTQFKEILRPVSQLSAQIQPRSNLAIGAYYQFRWESNRIPAAGSFLSDVDFVGDGAETLFVPGVVPLVPLTRISDMDARNSGQGGIQVRYRPKGKDLELGFYATRYHSKDFEIYVYPVDGTYQLVYPEDIDAYGMSFSTVFGRANVAGEVSYRHNTPLVSDPQVVIPGVTIPAGVTADNNDNPLYAVGNSVHAQLSTIVLLPPTKFWNGGDVLAEIAWHRRQTCDKNCTPAPANGFSPTGALDPNTTRSAWAIRVLFTPQYAQVLPGVDLTVPIGLGWNPGGRSSVIPKFNGGVEDGGDFSIGVNGDYLKVWKFGINYVHFWGEEGTFLTPPGSPTPVLSYEQSLKDRNFISIYMQRTF